MIGPFCTHHSICLNTASWYGSVVWKWYVFNLSSFKLKNGTPVFWKKGFHFPENLFQNLSIENVQNFQWLSHVDLLNWGLFWKSLVSLEELMLFLLTLKWSLWEKRYPVLRQKLTKFCRKTCWKEQPFVFTVYLMNHNHKSICTLNTCHGMNRT